jgi:hypothetical protein
LDKFFTILQEGTFKTVKPGGVAIGTWASGTNINTARQQGGAVGTVTASLTFGGYTTANVGNTEQWDGSSWSEQE